MKTFRSTVFFVLYSFIKQISCIYCACKITHWPRSGVANQSSSKSHNKTQHHFEEPHQSRFPLLGGESPYIKPIIFPVTQQNQGGLGACSPIRFFLKITFKIVSFSGF